MLDEPHYYQDIQKHKNDSCLNDITKKQTVSPGYVSLASQYFTLSFKCSVMYCIKLHEVT